MVNATKVDTAIREYPAEKLENTEGENRRIEDNQKHPDFICPICRSKKFKEEYENNGIFGPGSRSWRVRCVCVGCTVVFIDPEKFSENRAFCF